MSKSFTLFFTKERDRFARYRGREELIARLPDVGPTLEKLRVQVCYLFGSSPFYLQVLRFVVLNIREHVACWLQVARAA